MRELGGFLCVLSRKKWQKIYCYLLELLGLRHDFQRAAHPAAVNGDACVGARGFTRIRSSPPGVLAPPGHHLLPLPLASAACSDAAACSCPPLVSLSLCCSPAKSFSIYRSTASHD